MKVLEGLNLDSKLGIDDLKFEQDVTEREIKTCCAPRHDIMLFHLCVVFYTETQCFLHSQCL